MKKYSSYILILIICVSLFTGLKASASEKNPGEPCKPPTNPTNQPCGRYVLLSPIDVEGEIETFDPGQEGALGEYLNLMIKIIIGLSAVMAVVMIVIGGMGDMTSELISSKEE